MTRISGEGARANNQFLFNHGHVLEVDLIQFTLRPTAAPSFCASAVKIEFKIAD
jgi:hypothetical protein